MKYIVIMAFLCLGCQVSKPTVTEVISADTVILSDGTKLRYAGLTAPQPQSHWFDDCRDANIYLVQDKTVEVVLEPELAQNGVALAYLYTPVIVGDKTQYLFVNAEIARFGFAYAQSVPKQCQHPALWQNIWNLQENEAKPLARGIWSSPGR